MQGAWDLLWQALTAARRAQEWHPAHASPTGALRHPDRGAALALADARGVRGLVALGLGRTEEVPRVDDERRVQAGRGTLAHVHQALLRAGVRHAFFKGPLADGVLWGGRGLRGYTDVDVLVEDERAGVAALTDAHYAPHPLPGYAAHVEAGKARLLVPSHDIFLPVDLHHRPLNAPPFRARTADILEATRELPTRDGALPGPRPEHMLVWSAGNLAGGRMQGLVAQAADAAAWIERPTLGPAFDWDVVVAAARAWRASSCTFALLRLLEARLDVRVPAEALRALAPVRPVARWAERVFGVRGAPAEGTKGFAGVVAVEWPLSGRGAWPARRVARTLRLRAADALRSRS